MRGQQMRFQLTAVGLACVTLLSACGGSKSNSDLKQKIAFPSMAEYGAKVAPPGEPLVNLLMAAKASSGLAVTYKSNTPAVCSVDNATLTLLSAGTCSVSALQAGGNGYVAAEKQQFFVIPKNDQTVIFRNPGPMPVGQALPLPTAFSRALGSADLYPFVYATTTPEVCTVTETTVNTHKDGACVITASQAGTDYYLPREKKMTIEVGTFKLPPLIFVSKYDKATAFHTFEQGRIETYNQFSATPFVPEDGSTFTYSMAVDSPAPGFGGYYGFRFFAPGLEVFNVGGDTTDGVQIEGQQEVKFNLKMNPEMSNANAAKDKTSLRVWLVLGHYNKRLDGGDHKYHDCNVILEKRITPTFAVPGEMQEQTINLHDFILTQTCGLSGLNPFDELRDFPVVQMEFNVNPNDVTPNEGTTTYTTAVTTGTINFK